MSAEKIAEVLAEHYPSPVWCKCGWKASLSLNDSGSDRQQTLHHVAEALAPLLAAEREAGIEEGVDSTWHLKEIMRREREAGRAEALQQAAEEWQINGWTILTPGIKSNGGSAAAVINAAQNVTDWLRDRLELRDLP